MEFRRAKVSVNDRFCGILEETDGGYRFTYDPIYLSSEKPSAVSLTMPLQASPYESKTLFPFFDGLIPEGWLFNAVTKNWKIDSYDRFGILLVSAADPIGNVSIKEETE